jgi:very-short-patch-repair endonuclease
MKKRANQLRETMTLAEAVLWQHLRNRRFQKIKFRRQHPIGRYIVDFVCLEKHLVIELDGGQHQEQIEYDQRRTDYLTKQGFRVIRFWNNEFLMEQEAVLQAIYNALFSCGEEPI